MQNESQYHPQEDGSMDTFRERFEALEQRTEHVHQQTRTAHRRLRWWRGVAGGVGLRGRWSPAGGGR
jgi:hypothetical protein